MVILTFPVFPYFNDKFKKKWKFFLNYLYIFFLLYIILYFDNDFLTSFNISARKLYRYANDIILHG